MRTAVEGWGLGFLEVTREDRESFEELGRECWREMEALRVAWEERLRQE